MPAYVERARGRGCPQPATAGSFERYHQSRRIYTARVDYTFQKGTSASVFWALNDTGVRGQPPAVGINAIDSQNHFVGVLFTGDFGIVKPIFEAVSSFGHVGMPDTANPVNDFLGSQISGKDFKIQSMAAYADVAFDLSKIAGFKLEPHLGGFWVQGDNDPTDNTLSGYSPIVALNRFMPRWGGENLITGDGNLAWGSPLYSFLPEMSWGNQSNQLSNGGGLISISRADNPGMIMIGGGVDSEPVKDKLRFRTNAYAMMFNADFLVGAIPDAQKDNASSLGLVPRDTGTKRLITSRFYGVEWDSEITYLISKTVFFRFQFSLLAPGPGARQVVGALSNQGNGTLRTIGAASIEEAAETDATMARRLGAEVVWNF